MPLCAANRHASVLLPLAATGGYKEHLEVLLQLRLPLFPRGSRVTLIAIYKETPAVLIFCYMKKGDLRHI